MLKAAVLVAAVATMLVGVVGSGAAGAAPAAAPVEMSYACALKAGGLMRYVQSPGQCLSKFETAVTIKPGPVNTCLLRSGLVYRTSSTCTVRGSSLLTLPPASGNVYFCALRILGVLRAVSSASQCSKFEFAVVVTPNNRAPNAVADTFTANGAVEQLNVRGNDSDPDGDSFLITALGGSPVGIPTITGGGTGISYDSEPAWDETSGAGQSFTDTFTYTITDARGASATTTVTVITWDESFDYTAHCIPLSLSDATVQAGDTITASGTTVTGGGSITMLLDESIVIGQTTSSTTPNNPPGDPSGNSYNWSTSVTIPAGTSPGNHTIRAAQIRSTTQPQGCPSQIAGITVEP
jgi:hypothetical protein